MIDVIKNPIKKQRVSERSQEAGKKVEAFRSERSIHHYLNTKVYNKSKFINQALNIFILLKEDRVKLFTELKRLHPEEWKYVNRRRL